MKTMIKGKIVTADEMSEMLTTDDSGGITYDDIRLTFTAEDLGEYDRLCESFVDLIGNKNNMEQWEMLFDPVSGLNLMSVLNRIEELRSKYDLPGTFHRVWRARPLGDGKLEYDEVSW